MFREIYEGRLGRICRRENVTKIRVGNTTLEQVPPFLSPAYEGVEVDSKIYSKIAIEDNSKELFFVADGLPSQKIELFNEQGKLDSYECIIREYHRVIFSLNDLKEILEKNAINRVKLNDLECDSFSFSDDCLNLTLILPTKKDKWKIERVKIFTYVFDLEYNELLVIYKGNWSALRLFNEQGAFAWDKFTGKGLNEI